MNTKTLLTIAALSSAGWLTSFAQTGSGSAGAGSGAGAAGTGAGSSAASGTATGAAGTAAGATATPGGSNIGALPTPGVPNLTPTRAIGTSADPAMTNPTVTNPPGTPALPPGVVPATTAPGVSPISGIRTSDIPSVSAGIEPVAAQPSTSDRRPPRAGTVTEPAGAASRQPRGIVEPVAGAAQPAVNTQIGTGEATTYVPTPPPEAHVESAPSVARDGNQVWVPGHYSWQNGQWTWVAGGWQRPPTPGATWVPGNYDRQNHRWTEGHWYSGANVQPAR